MYFGTNVFKYFPKSLAYMSEEQTEGFNQNLERKYESR